MKRFFAILISIVLVVCLCGCEITISQNPTGDSSAQGTSSDVGNTVTGETKGENNSGNGNSGNESAGNSSPSSNSGSNASAKTGSTKSTSSKSTTSKTTSSKTSSAQSGSTSSGSGSVPAETPTVKTFDTGYWYSKMTATQKAYYNAILGAARSMNTGEVFCASSDSDFAENSFIAYMGVQTDHPEIFWFKNEYSMTVKNGKDYYITLAYSYSKSKVTSMKAELNKKVKSIISKTAGMSDAEKERYFHDTICKTTSYSATGGASIYTSYGCLIGGKAVCEGYARALQLLCLSSGIECTLLRGKSEGDDHMWNAVKLDSDWYQVDVTWDDAASNKGISYKFYNLTDAKMGKDHTLAYNYKNGCGKSLESLDVFNFYTPACKGTKYAYKK